APALDDDGATRPALRNNPAKPPPPPPPAKLLLGDDGPSKTPSGSINMRAVRPRNADPPSASFRPPTTGTEPRARAPSAPAAGDARPPTTATEPRVRAPIAPASDARPRPSRSRAALFVAAAALAIVAGVF